MHLLTGPVAIENAEPGDILEVRILDIRPRPSCNACHAGRCFGSNVAASLGLSLSRPDRGAEAARGHHHLRARHLRRAATPRRSTIIVWTPQTDPDGIVHPTIDYPGVRVDHATCGSAKTSCPTSRCRRGCISAPWGSRRRKPISSARFRRATPAATSTTGASARARECIIRSPSPARCFSVGDPHAAQGDSELGGTAIETSLTGDFEFILHKNHDLGGTMLEGLTHPMLETDQQWSMYGFTFPNYLAELGAERPDRDCQPFKPRPGDARCVPKTAPLPDDGAPHERGRGDLADVGRRPISASPRSSTPIGAYTARSARTSSGATNEQGTRFWQFSGDSRTQPGRRA